MVLKGRYKFMEVFFQDWKFSIYIGVFLFIIYLFICFFQSVENQCGWSEKRNQDTLDDLRETIKEKDKTIEVIDKH